MARLTLDTIPQLADPIESAKAARLRYISDAEPGITRQRRGDGFVYTDPDGRRIRDDATLQRIKGLVIPPAWTDVWISPSANGHLQATGRDARGRKQYRYHARWRELRDETKYGRMILFGQALPRIRRAVDEDLKLPGLSRRKVVAAVVTLLERTLIRVGNEEYARSNHSYGLTTLRDRHVEIEGAHVEFRFTGKSGVRHDVELRDRRLARIIRACQEIPGQELFQYVDDDGSHQPISSTDINDYLHEVAGEEFTAKDFRTWAGTVHALNALALCPECENDQERKQRVADVITEVSSRLGNTPSVCRKCYVHPAVIDAWLEGRLAETLRRISASKPKRRPARLDPEEVVALVFLKESAKEG
jgi:DNA topoisomerase-1